MNGPVLPTYSDKSVVVVTENAEIDVIQMLDVYFVVLVCGQRVREDSDATHFVSGDDGFILNLNYPQQLVLL